jgi:GT2 family glycosyltransferase
MSSPTSRIAVVILNWNGVSFLEKYLPGVLKSCKGIAELIVADNASTDTSVEFIERNFPSVRIIKLPKNNGFTGGYNESLKLVNSEYYVLLNSDVEVKDDWISPVIRLMDSNKNIAACQPKILSQARPKEFEYAGAAGGYIDKYGYPFCRGRIFNSIEEDLGQYNDSRRIFWATGACMFVRANCFHELNGFDPHFFAHMEEIDLCWRMQQKGYEIWYCAESKVYHVGGGTLPKNNPKKTYYNFRNNLFLLYKNVPKAQFKKILFYRRIFDSIAALKFLISNGRADCSAVFRAHKDFNSGKKRYEGEYSDIHLSDIQSNKMVLQKSILFTYYMRGIQKFSELKGC